MERPFSSARRRLMYGLSLVLGCTCLAGSVMGQLQLERVYPPVVTIGSQGLIQAEGKFPNWPPRIDCDRSDLVVTAGDQSGELKVVVPQDAAPGVAWLRLFDDTSASRLVPLMIETMAVSLEAEPNNRIPEATPLPLASTVAGRLQKSEDVDHYRVEVRRGQRLVVSAVAHQVLRSPMDAVLQIVDLRGNVLAQSDDERGLDPQIVFDVPTDTELIVRIFAFPETPNSTIGFAGSASFVYALRVTAGPYVDHLLPLLVSRGTSPPWQAYGWNLPDVLVVTSPAHAPESSRVGFAPDVPGWQWTKTTQDELAFVFEASAGEEPVRAESLPAVFSGHILQADEVDAVRFSVQKDRKYRAEVISRDFGFHLDSMLRVVEPDSAAEISRNDDASRSNYDARLDFSAPSDGELELQISDLVHSGSLRHAYSVYLHEVQPAVALSVADDHFALSAGKELEIPVTVNRQDGFDKKLRISVEGLPEGLRAESRESLSKGDSAKQVKITIVAEAAAPPFQGPIRFVAHEAEGEGQSGRSKYYCKFSLRPQVQVEALWLTVSGK